MRQALQDSVETSRHLLGIIIIIIVVITIAFIGELFLRCPITPLFGSSFLERLTLEVLPLLLLLLHILYGFMLLCRGAPFLALRVILLHRRPRGLGVDRPLAK